MVLCCCWSLNFCKWTVNADAEHGLKSAFVRVYLYESCHFTVKLHSLRSSSDKKICLDFKTEFISFYYYIMRSLFSGCLLHRDLPLRNSDRSFGSWSPLARSLGWALLPFRSGFWKTPGFPSLEEGCRANVLLPRSVLGWLDDVWLLQQVPQQSQHW